MFIAGWKVGDYSGVILTDGRSLESVYKAIQDKINSVSL